MVDHDALERRGRALFVRAAKGIAAADVNLMAKHGRGLISAAMRPSRAFALGLQPMAAISPERAASPYMASVEATRCSETGISAAERALTLHVLGAPDTQPENLVTPGHIMPAVIREDAPGALELVSIALDHEGRTNGAEVIAWCDILDNEGEVASWTYAVRLARHLGCPLLVRRGNAVVDADALATSRRQPVIPVLDSGLELSHFA
ncbi:3,4-dihydroxy-2-butanone-4-phosphate synthase [Sphingobium algorifonticola]|uniref:3,4-dihydroxy-2-butanone-4-phosphate synthase n=1 Tax=Sphingobium algorifonticola TaxID=2008318 RepID=UPI0013E295F6|nr:3,4-dihydroxy-2-butanone-4-phosphate synthase [Sphingobium algorifonticola]